MARLDSMFENNASGQLSAGITDSATSLALKAGEGAEFPTLSGSQYFHVTLQKSSGAWEIVKVTAVSGDSFTTIVRNVDSSTGSAMAFSADDIVSLRPIAENLEDVKTAINNLGTLADEDAAGLTLAVMPKDHGTASDPEIVAVVYGTGSPPTASNTPIGTIFVKYEA
jgi:hypothetical protein